ELGNINRMVDNVFKPQWYENKSRLEIMQYILEGLKMPVQNPKTGEQDYVDVSLVNKIIIDSEYVEDMIINKKIKIDFSLSGDASKKEVYLKANSKEVSYEESQTIPLQTFEEMLFKAINEIKAQRLEEVEEFKAITSNLISSIVSE